ncbi:MAG TPA: hypothetical protein VF753_03010 [Terriglobales bacterium]
MRIYEASSEEALRARSLLKDWADEGCITPAQHQQLETETVSDLRTTNIFLRLTLFLFTSICVGAAVGLFFKLFLFGSPDETEGIFLLLVAGVCYVSAEFAVSRFHLYRYGIEEALLACSVGFFCAGLLATFFSGMPYSPKPSVAEFVVPAFGAILSLWIWQRFGLWYAFLAAMIFAVFLPGYWTSSHPVQHVIVVFIYAIGLGCVIAVRPRHRFDYLNDSYSLAEALLWLGIYLTINLKLSSFERPIVRSLGPITRYQFPQPFYWATWLLTWLLPAVVLFRGVREKDRFVIAAGAITAILTFITNKPYLGWPRHTWDPMILGILLTGVALYIRRWLAQGPNGIRHGFTAARLSAKDKQWLNAGSAVLGLVSPVAPAPQPATTDFRFGGGASGGGGARRRLLNAVTKPHMDTAPTRAYSCHGRQAARRF